MFNFNINTEPARHNMGEEGGGKTQFENLHITLVLWLILNWSASFKLKILAATYISFGFPSLFYYLGWTERSYVQNTNNILEESQGCSISFLFFSNTEEI